MAHHQCALVGPGCCVSTFVCATHSCTSYLQFLPPFLQWLMKALLWNNESSSSEAVPLTPSGPQQQPSVDHDRRWRMVVSDGSLAGSSRLVPPTTMCLQHAVDLQDVITVTDEARLVVESTPPFCIVVRTLLKNGHHLLQLLLHPFTHPKHFLLLCFLVLPPLFFLGQHANKAFLECANLQGTDALVGRPVESIFRVSRESTTTTVPALPPPPFTSTSTSTTTTFQGNNDNNDNCTQPLGPRYLHGTIAVSSMRNRSRRSRNGQRHCQTVKCRLQVVPVMDRSRRRKIHHQPVKKGSGPTRPCLSMSHILIHVEREPPTLSPSSLEPEKAEENEDDNDDDNEEDDLASLFRSMENDPLEYSSMSSKTDSASGPSSSSDQGVVEMVG